MEASVSLGRDNIGWTQSRATGEMLRERVIMTQFAWAIKGILACVCAALDNMETEKDLELKNAAEERQLHRMAKVHDWMAMWQGSQNLCATQKQSCAQN